MLKRISLTYALSLFVLTSSLAASSADEMVATTEYDYKGQLFKLLLTASILIAGLIGGGYAIKRLGRSRLISGPDGSKLRIVMRRPLSPKSALYLIEAEGHRLLVGDSQHGGLRTLLSLPPRKEEQNTPSFQEILERSAPS